jgi:hypothetical protein
MGIPKHYSRDIAIRCANLVEHLFPQVEAGLPDDQKFGGELTTTFLLAMATPAIILPVDRVVQAGPRYVADDVGQDHQFADVVKGALDNDTPFSKAPFFLADAWSFVPKFKRFNIAEDWPTNLLDMLSTNDAIVAANNTPARKILVTLRNALAHGGIAYLDRNGRQMDVPAGMVAFAGAEGTKKNASLNILRVRQNDFRVFIAAWTQWLERAGIESRN